MGQSLTKRTLAIIALAVSVLALPARADTPTLLVVGDSITCGMLSRSDTCGRNYRGFGNLREALLARGTFGEVIVDASYSRNVAGVADTRRNGAKTIAKQLKGRQVDALIVALGSNDLQHSSRPAFFEKSIREVMTLAAGRPVAWVTVYRSDSTYYPRRAKTFNAVLARLAREYSNLQVVDWSTALIANPKWQAFDKLHLQPAGYRARIPYFTAAADSLWARLQPPTTTYPATTTSTTTTSTTTTSSTTTSSTTTSSTTSTTSTTTTTPPTTIPG